MANHVSEKFLSSTADAYRHPIREQTSYKHYHPQTLIAEKYDYSPNKGTKAWFQDYRRSVNAEKTLRQNLSTLETSLRPTDYSDKPDMALGERKIQRESLFPIIYNNPVYQLTSTNHNRRNREISFIKDTQLHRTQYKDLTGSLHKKIDRFYYPFPAKESFDTRYVSKDFITGFPGHHTSANEYMIKPREKRLVNYNKLDVCI